MHDLVKTLYPICRSITGDGVRQSLTILKERIPLEMHEVRTGTRVFDWTVPKEWNIRDAYVMNSIGERVVDFRKSNLHVLNYSVPVRTRMPLAELRPHLWSIPERPGSIPYKTSYYSENWGFCLRHYDLVALEEGDYDVVIDSSLQDGHLSYGEFVSKGEKEEEMLISCHICHPSLCNDNLSGVVLSAFLAELLSNVSHRYTYRFVFIPGTIGAITWLALNEKSVDRIRHGLVVACVGDPGYMRYKKSRRGDVEIDRTVERVLKDSGEPFEIAEFSPYGYDERQYCSPAFNLSVGSLTRTPHGKFPEYHTSDDNLDLVQPQFLAHSLRTYLQVIWTLENNRTYLNLNPKCEPQLGRRGLYSLFGGHSSDSAFQLAVLWVLNLSDGSNSLLDIAVRSGMKFESIQEAALALERVELIRRLNTENKENVKARRLRAKTRRRKGAQRRRR
jgi:aminopeptidase-like protein